MGTKPRLFATVFIWTVAVLVGMALEIPTGFIIPVLGIIAGTVLICMGFIWNWGQLPLTMDAPAQSGKAKRSVSDRAALLRELLDDDELEAVKARLMADISGNHYDDGELPLTALLDEEEQR